MYMLNEKQIKQTMTITTLSRKLCGIMQLELWS